MSRCLILHRAARLLAGLLALPLIGGPPAASAQERTAAFSVEAAVERMTMPDGFHVDAIAAEPDLFQPIAFCFDERGRIWVVEGNTYPQRAPDGEGKDRILIFEDTNGDGTFDSRKVFTEGLNLVSGIEVGFGGVFVGAAPWLLFIPDRDRDDVPDAEPEILLDGWGWHDTHETLNSFVWGPDGWLYGCHGVFTHSKVGRPGTPDDERTPLNCGFWRYHPSTAAFEVFAHGTSNPWGLDYNDLGHFFAEACVIPHFWHVVQGGYYLRQSNPLGHFNPNIYTNIETIADHVHYIGATPHSGNDVSDAAGGGHAHCGLCIYLGDTFPPEYRNRPMFFNIHGHRINQEELVPAGSGYVARHLPDFVKSNDPWFTGVALKVGPDGSVYFIDWQDRQKCHRTEPLIWDRSNGRMYRVRYGEAIPWRGDLAALDDVALAGLQDHANDWFARTSRRILQERAGTRRIATPAHAALRTRLEDAGLSDPKRLRAMWTLHATGGFDDGDIEALLGDSSEHVRSWAIQLLYEDRNAGDGVRARLLAMAQDDPSPVVRLHIASALQRMPLEARWAIASALAAHAADAGDHNLPQMIWYAIEPCVPADPGRALILARDAKIPLLSDHIARRVAADESALPHLVASLAAEADEGSRLALLKALTKGLEGKVGVAPPEAWDRAFASLSTSDNPEIRSLVTGIAVAFGDVRAFPGLREAVRNPETPLPRRQAALQTLVEGRDPDLGPVLVDLLDSPELRLQALRALASTPAEGSAEKVLAIYGKLPLDERQAAVAALAARAGTAHALLDAIAAGTVARADLPSFAARQIANLGDPALTAKLEDHWGKVGEDASNAAEEMTRLRELLAPEFLKTADVSAGRVLFQQVCATCHTLFNEGNAIGPDLTGSNRANLEYILENVTNPNALVGKDYELHLLTLRDGRVVSGMIRRETDSALTVGTLAGEEIVARRDITSHQTPGISMMPVGLFTALNNEQIRDLVAYLASPEQVPLPGEAGAGKTVWRVPGAIEGETMEILGTPPGAAQPQDMAGFPKGRWSGNAQLWWTEAKPGQQLHLALPVAEAGTYALGAVLTRAVDYGTVRFLLDGKPISKPIDLFGWDVVTTDLLPLGELDLAAGVHRLTVEITGANPEAVKKFMFGLDYLWLERRK